MVQDGLRNERDVARAAGVVPGVSRRAELRRYGQTDRVPVVQELQFRNEPQIAQAPERRIALTGLDEIERHIEPHGEWLCERHRGEEVESRVTGNEVVCDVSAAVHDDERISRIVQERAELPRVGPRAYGGAFGVDPAIVGHGGLETFGVDIRLCRR
jgi:hypothetical protein